MHAAQTASDEAARLEALRELDIIDTGREPVFDRLVSVARDLSGAEIAAITLLDHDRLWVKAIEGLQLADWPRELALNARAALGSEVFWVEDARVDARFRAHGLVASGEVRFYAGAPLITASGHAVGTLCVADSKPRARDEALVRRLGDLASLVVDALEQRLARRGVELQVARALVRQAPTSISVLDRAFRFLLVSEKMEVESAVTEAELVGRRVDELFPETKPLQPLMTKALGGRTLSGKRAPLRRRDGTVAICDWELAPWYRPDGSIGGIRVMTFDVTEIVQSQEAASRSEQRLKLALDVADTLVWELEFKTGRIETVGDAERFFDEPLQAARFAEDLLAIIHPDDHAQIEEAWRATIGQDRPFQVECRLRRESGEDFWVMASAQAFNGPDGRPERLIGALRDITQRKQKDLALERARAEAEAANRAKSEFLANMSHEIRTPLNGVLGVAGALGRTSLGDHQRSMVKLIESSAHHLEGLLSDVLDLARVESGKLELHREPFSPRELIGATAALFAKQAQEKGIGFQFEQHDPLEGRCLGDPVRLRQVLSNLLSNAVKFTARGGVTIRVAASTSPTRQAIRIAVTDTGVGFDDEARERLFQRFEQADGSITRRFGGTGLGLSISRALIEAMGGRIEAESTPGVGSTFTLTVELEREDAAPAEPAPQVANDCDKVLASGPLRVLLAEDHPVNRKVVELILGAAGIDLVMVEDGAQAVEAFSGRGPFDLVLMDVQMPVMDGLTAIRAIRAREAQLAQAPTPIVALTANAMPEHTAASEAAGADGHVSKPVSAAVLLGVLDQVRQAQTAPELALSA